MSVSAVLDEDIDWPLIKSLVFGSGGVQESVFERWLQPFTFSSKEPTALVQLNGGPCAVLAPIQAHIIKQCLQDSIQNLQTLSEETVKCLLRGALAEILLRCRSAGRPVTLARVTKEVALAWQESRELSSDVSRSPSSSSKRMRCELVDVDTFHTCLTVETFHTSVDLTKYLEDHFPTIFGTKYDVLSFLYSVVLTKGPSRIVNERQDMEESLIDPLHGHGSQSLVNLLITGAATQNVFDGTKDLCGLELEGIASQSQVGFLSFLECLRYLEVGNNLKCPAFPIWILGSETHLTLLFSRDRRLVQPPSLRETAARKFKELDSEDSGFVATDQLKELMESLELFAEDAYVNIMRNKIDPDNLGIILLPQFLDEFFPETEDSRLPDVFTLYHYNGLHRPSCPHVKYIKGEAVLLEGAQGRADNNPMLQTLQTKWKAIAVDWETEPSLN